MLRRTLLRISQCAKEIDDLTVTKCHRRADFNSMPKILKNKNIMTRFPKMGSYPQGLGHTRTITWTYQNGGCGSWARIIPAANFVVAFTRREDHRPRDASKRLRTQ